MNDLSKSFSTLFSEYSDVFTVNTYSGESRVVLMKQVPTKTRGVYLYWKKGEQYPLYIGCSGKVSSNGELGGSTVKTRMFSANTPYHVSKTEGCLFYSPTTAGVPPAGYHAKLSLDDLMIKVITVNETTAPAALEHLLLQGFINEFGRLPDANQKV